MKTARVDGDLVKLKWLLLTVKLLADEMVR